MAPSTAIKITLYSENDEKKDTYQRLIVPWGMLKRAVRMSKNKKGAEVTEAQIDEISDLLVELFKGSFTREELEAGADVGEIMACFQSIIAKAKGIIPNAPPPAK